MPARIEKHKQLLVEGKDEANLFRAFASKLDISDLQVQAFNGKNRLSAFLEALVNASGFSDVTSLGIIRDADGDENSAYRSVRDSLERAGLSAPPKPMQQSGSHPVTQVMILPGAGRTGMLETLLWETVGPGEADCIEKFFRCIQDATGQVSERPDKARVHAYIATTDELHVSVGVAAQKGVWEIDHDALRPVRKFLRSI